MNKELEQEAEKHADYSNENIPLSFGGKFNESHKRTFIAGATSKWVEKQKLKFAIEQLKRFRECTFGKGIDVIEELKQKLSEL